MDIKRVWRTVRINTFLNGNRRLDYIKKKHIFASFGDKSTFAPKVIPLYPELISIGNNVRVAAKVSFVTHDMIHAMLNNRTNNDTVHPFREYLGCIKIDDNVFIGTGVLILPDVHIGNNCIIGAGTLVNKDLEAGYVYGGTPVRKICSFEQFVEKRMAEKYYPDMFSRKGDSVNKEFAEWLWDDFHKRRY